MEKLITYIKKVTGIPVNLEPIDKEELKGLPLFIRRGFTITKGLLNEKGVIFIFPLNRETQRPKQLQVQISKIENHFARNAVVVFEEVDSYMKNQLIEMKTAFIVPGGQIFIPWMFISLDERKNKRLRKVDQFYPATQSILIYHLWKSPLNGMNMSDVANVFNYSKMTISRAVKELEAVGVCTVNGDWEKTLEFKGTKRQVWGKAKEYLKSPVGKRIEFTEIADHHTLIVSGVNALSNYSNISKDYRHVFAVSKEAYKPLLELNTAAEYGDTVLEVWNYDPELLEREGTADPFSLYLSLQDHEDERVQIALEEMMEAVL